ncbi:MAG: diadenylate cyclase CdaA [Prevotellaceae bacterium]|nr:diadenylate cyclase CdaA [Prevotellaceae bacterium]
MLGFQFGIKDIFDIILVAVVLYYAYLLLKKTGGLAVFFGIIVFVVIWYLVFHVFQMELLGGLLDKIMGVGGFAIIVIFHDEIRRFFSRIGSGKGWNFVKILKKIFSNTVGEKQNIEIMQIVIACRNMARNYIGALIVITRNNDLEYYVQSGEIIDANVNSRLIENIFFKNSPLHDGALIVAGRRLQAAGCILPVSRSSHIPKTLGLRHRAAMGITEQTDAMAIVVSEETGTISFVINGQITSKISPEQLEELIANNMIADY